MCDFQSFLYKSYRPDTVNLVAELLRYFDTNCLCLCLLGINFTRVNKSRCIDSSWFRRIVFIYGRKTILERLFRCLKESQSKNTRDVQTCHLNQAVRGSEVTLMISSKEYSTLDFNRIYNNTHLSPNIHLKIRVGVLQGNKWFNIFVWMTLENSNIQLKL